MNTPLPCPPRHPDLKDDRLALWILTTRLGKPYYRIAEHLPYVPPIYTTVSGELNGARLSPHDALKLYKGDSIEVVMQGRTGRYTAFLAMRSIKIRSDPEFPEKETRSMDLAIIFQLLKNGEPFGYQIDRITVSDTIGGGSSGRVKLKPNEALMLLDGKTLTLGQRGQYTVRLRHVTETVHPDRTTRIARISATQGPQEEIPTPADMVPLGAPFRPLYRGHIESPGQETSPK